MAYQYKRTITIDHTKCGSANSTAFPVLFSGTYNGTGGIADLRTTINGGKVQNLVTVNGQTVPADITFTSDSAGTTALPFEIASYSPTTGQIEVWIKSDVTFAADTLIYVWYGDVGVTLYQGGAVGSAWDTNYKGVWHLPNGTTLSANDSTSNGKNGTLVNSPTAATGQIDGAMNLVAASSQYVNVGTVTVTGLITMSAWLKIGSFPTSGNFMSILNDSYSTGSNSVGHYFDLLNASGIVNLRTGNFTSGATHGTNWAITGWNTGEWHYVTGAYDGSTWRLYVDGVQKSSSIDANGSGNLGNTYMGALSMDGTPGRLLNGVMDEARISSIARSVDWTLTEYNNQLLPDKTGGAGGFYTVGVEVGVGASTITKTHTADSLKLLTTAKTHTTSSFLAVIISTATKTHTADALIRATKSKTHGTDSLLKNTTQKTHTADSLARATFSKLHTTNALLKITQNKVHTADSLARASQAKTHSTSAYLATLAANTKTHSADSLLKATTARTHTADSLKYLRIIKTHTSDSLIKQTSQKSHTGDAYLQAITGNFRTHTTNSLLKATANRTHSTSAVLFKTSTASHTANALLFASQSKTHTADSALRATKTVSHTTSSILKTARTIVHTADSFLYRAPNIKSHSTDSLLRMTGTANAGNYTLKLPPRAFTLLTASQNFIIKTEKRNYTLKLGQP